MKIKNRKKLEKFMQKHADARKTTANWIHDITEAKWETTMDIKRVYADASFLSKNNVVFNIRGNNYRFVVVVVYVAGEINVKFAGTHAEYDKLKLK